MEINNFSHLLEKFKNLEPSDKHKKETIIGAVEEICGHALRSEELRVQGDVVFLKTHPALKSEIFLKKKEILKAVSKKLKKGVVTNIL